MNLTCPECESTNVVGDPGWAGAPNADPPEPPEPAYVECLDCGWDGDPDDLQD